MALLDKILIANRGEIARRIIRTCKRLQVRTVAVYSDEDKDASHVHEADEAVYIGASPAQESYLLGEKILDAAKKTNAKGIHPGYGFLSENAAFAQIIEDSGKVRFIGPPASAIRGMGSKSGSKLIMTKAQVPCTPGYHGQDQTMDRLKKEAARCGFPLMLKADAGGGGKGMRIVENMEEFEEKAASCRREAMSSFKDDKILMEKYVRSARHVEFQIFADSFGNCIHLYERDCSVQRRHQKVLEESPAPFLDPELRAAMGRASVQAAKAVGYVGAGTVEFMLDADDPNKSFYFMEMNTRLQVEHPVTEMVTGLDLVEWQLLVASGYALPLKQEEIHITGHALEARVYAENPAGGFLPGSGPLKHIREPASQTFNPQVKSDSSVRVETGVQQGGKVSIYYDPMISKLVVHGKDREEALNKMEASLAQYRVAGLSTNIEFLHSCVAHPEFKKGGVSTSFIATHMETLLPQPTQKSKEHPYSGLGYGEDEGKIVALASIAANALRQALALRNVHADESFFRVDATAGLSKSFNLNSILPGATDKHSIRVNSTVYRAGPKSVRVLINVDGHHPIEALATLSKTQDAEELHFDLELLLKHENHHDVVRIPNLIAWFGVNEKNAEETLHLFSSGRLNRLCYQVLFMNPDFSPGDSAEGLSSFGGSIAAPMPGKVTKLMVKPGDAVQANQPLIFMEAMKMEHVLKSPKNAKVLEVLTSEGELVSDAQVLIKLG